MSIHKNKFLLTSLILILYLATTPKISSASNVTPPLTKCFIRVDNPHLSDSIKRKRGFDAVKVNAISICDKELLSLKITVEIYKKGFLRNYKVVSKTLLINSYIPANKTIEHKGTWERCKNERASKYYGTAYAVAVIQGKNMRTLPVTTQKTISLPCGT